MPADSELSIIVRAKDFASRALRTIQGSVSSFSRAALRSFGAVRRGIFSLRSAFLAAATVAGLGVGAQFEAGIAQVSTLVDTSVVDMKRLEAGVRGVGVATGDSFDSLNKALFDTISAGVRSGDAIETLSTAAKLGAGGATTTSAAVKGLVSIMNAYGLTAKETTSISDSLFQAMKGGITTVELLSSNVGKVAPVARSAGLSFDEMLAGISALTKGGLSTEEAVTALRATLAGLIKPQKDAVTEAKKLGIELSTAGLKAKGLGGFLTDLAQKTNLNEETIGRLFGNIRAFVGVQALASDGAKNFTQILGTMATKAGSTEEAFGKVSETTSFKFKQAMAAAKTVLIELFNALKPLIDDGLEGFTNAVKTSGPAIKAWATFVADVFRAVFNFLVDRWNRYSADQSKLWSDLGKLVAAFFNVAMSVTGTGLRIISQAFVFTFRAIRDEIQGSLRGFSISDAIFKGDAFASLKDIPGQIERTKASIAKLKAGLEELRSTGSPFDFVARRLTTVALNQARDRLKNLEDLAQQPIQAFGEAFKKNFEEFKKAGVEEVGDFVDRFATEIGRLEEATGSKLGSELSAAVAKLKGALATGAPKEQIAAAGEVLGKQLTRSATRSIEEEAPKFAEAAAAGLAKLPDIAKDEIQKVSVIAQDLTDIFTGSFLSAFDQIADGTLKVRDFFRSLATDILRQLSRLALSRAFGALFGSLFGSIFPAGAAGGGGGFGEVSRSGNNLIIYGNGGVAPGGFRAFASGGVITQPTLGLIGEAGQNEAVVPLPDGRRIPVDLGGSSGGSAAPMTVNLNVAISALDGADAASVFRRNGPQLASAFAEELQANPAFAQLVNSGGAS